MIDTISKQYGHKFQILHSQLRTESPILIALLLFKVKIQSLILLQEYH